jgi:hypothetical protein
MPFRIRVPSTGTIGAPSTSSIFHIKVSGTWKQAITWIKVSGVWKQATPFVKIGGGFK